jgi:hypothetical protein
MKCLVLVIFVALTSFVTFATAAVSSLSSENAWLHAPSSTTAKHGHPLLAHHRLSQYHRLSQFRRLISASQQQLDDNTERHFALSSVFDLRGEPTVFTAMDDLVSRHLQQNANVTSTFCGPQAVFGGNCSLDEYCGALNTADDGVDVTCQGDVQDTWDLISSSSAESCFYFSAGSNALAPYDDVMFDSTLDMCFSNEVTISFQTFVPVVYYQTTRITRPKEGNLTETTALVACDDPTNEVIGGYCGTCTQALVGSDLCTSCQTCPGGSANKRALDCSNIYADLVVGCDDVTGDDVFVPFAEYVGVFCTFKRVTDGACTLEQFCKVFQSNDAFDSSTVCTGQVSGNWSVESAYSEECFYNITDTAEIGSPYDTTKFDAASGDHCSNSTVKLSFTGSTAVQEYLVRTLTKPLDSTGSYSFTSDLISCDTAVADYIFDGGVCAEECGELIIGSQLCTSGCKTCSGEYQAQTCTNVDMALVESCNQTTDATIVVLAYFKELNSGAAATPAASPPTATGVAPTASSPTAPGVGPTGSVAAPTAPATSSATTGLASFIVMAVAGSVAYSVTFL